MPKKPDGFFFTNTVQLPFLGLKGYTASVYTNSFGTNITVQVVFLPTNSFDTNLITEVRFAPGGVGRGG